MGRYTRAGTQITDFRPDDTDTTIHLASGMFGSSSLEDLIDAAKKKWPQAKLEDIQVSADHIHTECLGYDRYDPGDYTNYLVLTYAPPKSA